MPGGGGSADGLAPPPSPVLDGDAIAREQAIRVRELRRNPWRLDLVPFVDSPRHHAIQTQQAAQIVRIFWKPADLPYGRIKRSVGVFQRVAPRGLEHTVDITQAAPTDVREGLRDGRLGGRVMPLRRELD